jgi:tetratricopeptide (TPR) repeat protein
VRMTRNAKSIILATLIFCLVSSYAEAQSEKDKCVSGSAEEKLQACSKVISKDRRAAWAYVHRGISWTEKSNFDEAIADFNQAIKLEPNFPLAFNERGRAWMEKAEYQKAIADLNEAIRLEPKFQLAYNNRGAVWSRMEEHDKAIEDFNKAIKLYPKFRSAYSNRGYSWLNKGDTDRAIADYNKAIQIEPKNGSNYTDRGYAWERKGEYDKAIADFTEAIKLDPAHTLSYVGLCVSWYKKGDPNNTIASCTEAIKFEFLHAYSIRGKAWLRLGDYDKAIADLTEAIKLDANFPGQYLDRGYSWMKKGDFDKAIADYTEAINLDPEFVEAYYNRGGSWLLKGDKAKAIADFTETIRLDPIHVAAYASRGSVWLSIDDFDKAILDLEEALKLDSNNSDAKKYLAIAIEGKKKLTELKQRIPAQTNDRQQSGVVEPQYSVPAADEKSPPQAATNIKKLALVIGNAAYINASPLKNPINDADAIDSKLASLGFEVIKGTDLDKGGMEQSIRSFVQKLPTADIALFYYAGHGIQVGGRNYLIPIDALLADASAVDFELIDVETTVVRHLGGERMASIIILDSCRDNPLARSFARKFSTTRSGAVGQGLAQMSAGEGGLVIAFSTAPNETAIDGGGPNSPFTSALLNHIATPGLEFEQMMKRVRNEVYENTRGEQQPWTNSALRKEIFLTHKGMGTEAVSSDDSKLTQMTFMLVKEENQAPMLGTTWKIVSEDGRVVGESNSSYGVFELPQGSYTAVANKSEKYYTRDFKVIYGISQEIQLIGD